MGRLVHCYNRAICLQNYYRQNYLLLQSVKTLSRPLCLIERLNQGLERKLTLISAPAGFGKTTLVSEWVAVCERPVAWLLLDEGDNDPTRFLTYLVAALQTIASNIGVGALGVLQSPQPPPTEVIFDGPYPMKSPPSRTISCSSLTTTTFWMPNRLTMPSPFCSSTCRHRCT